MKKTVLVIFGDNIPNKKEKWWQQFNTVVASKRFEAEIKKYDLVFVDLNKLIDPGSIYEASALVEELSRLKFSDGTRITKSFIYKGYELWWMHCHGLFVYFCLPYTQYKKLLEYLRGFQTIYFYKLPYKNLFSYYLQTYGCEVKQLAEPKFKSPAFLHAGVLLQLILTVVSLPILIVKRSRLLVFIGDKFAKNCDYDFRVKFLYEELRQRHTPFIEFVRSLESWRIVWQHAITRRRPIIYTEAISFSGRFLGSLLGGRFIARRKFGPKQFIKVVDPESRFKLLLATHYLLVAYDDIWAIRIMKWILRMIGIRVALIEIASERSFHTVLGCKLNAIPTIGILHGVTSRYFVTHDFMPGFDGGKVLSVDAYGLWSEWWREYYLKNSNAYRANQLFISGPMRPLEAEKIKVSSRVSVGNVPKVLFIAEQLGCPAEVLPYLSRLIETEGIDLYLKFRPYHDGFEEWLKEHQPVLLDRVKILRGSVQEAVSLCDVVVGSHSTAVLEALFDLKPPIFYNTKRWGDYFSLEGYDPKYCFFAKTPAELIDCVLRSREIPTEILEKLQERFFGDPYKNGSKLVIDRCLKYLSER